MFLSDLIVLFVCNNLRKRRMKTGLKLLAGLLIILATVSCGTGGSSSFSEEMWKKLTDL